MTSANSHSPLIREVESPDDERIDLAVRAFSSGFNCAESMVRAYAEHFGVDRSAATRMACGLGAGMSGTVGICGAVSGAILVLGMKYGRDHPDDDASKETTYLKVKELCRRFTDTHGSTRCLDLLGVDISTEEGIEEARVKDLFTEKCPCYVEEAARLIEELITSI